MVRAFAGGPTGNRLLNLLPEDERAQVGALAQRVPLEARQVLYEARGTVDCVYFPVSAVLSAVAVMSDGAAIEVATMGNEGMSGLPTFALNATSPHRVFTQIAGDVLRIDAAAFNKLCAQLPALSRTMTSYQQAFLFQVSQSVACNGLHVIVERCCRWLLMTHDRVDGDDIALTHEFLSIMLGVRRSSVTEVLQSLQQQKLIRYRQGQIRVVNREGLDDLACECYRLVRDEYDRLLG